MNVPDVEMHEDRPQRRSRLLFLCQTLPFPPDGGVEIRSYNMLRILSRAYDTTALCFYRRAARGSKAQVQAALQGLSELGEVEVFPIPQEHSPLRFAWDHVRSVFTGSVYTRFVYRSKPLARRLNQLLGSRDFDLVHVDSLDLSTYLLMLNHIPVVCTHHNVESDLLRRRASASALPVEWYLRLQARFMEAEERKRCKAVDLNVTVSERDKARLLEIVPEARVVAIPNGVDTGFFRPGKGPEDGIVFVGGANWFPNRDAMVYFCNEVLPLLRNESDVPVTWVGRCSHSDRLLFQKRYDIRVTGYVEDIRDYVQRAACIIVPLRVGGGSRLKILDAWSMGKAVVATTLGAEGLRAHDGDNILIRDEPQEFSEAILQVLSQRALRTSLGRRGRKTVKQHYDWDVLGHRVLRVYRSLIDPLTDVDY